MPNFKKQKAQNDAYKAQKKAEIKEGFSEFQKSLPPKTPLVLAGCGAALFGFIFLKGIQSLISGGKKAKVEEPAKKPNMFVQGAKEIAVTTATDATKKVVSEYLEKILVDDEK